MNTEHVGKWHKYIHRTLTNVLLQYKHRQTASSNSSTTHPRATVGNQLGCSGDVRVDSGRNAFLLHPMHVRTHGVERMNVVIEHRATNDWASFSAETQDVLHRWSLLQIATAISTNGMTRPHAGQCSSTSASPSKRLSACTCSNKACASSDRSIGDLGSNAWMTDRWRKGISSSFKISDVKDFTSYPSSSKTHVLEEERQL